MDNGIQLKDLATRLMSALRNLHKESPIDDAYKITEEYARYAGRLVAEEQTTERDIRERIMPIVDGFAISRANNDTLVENELMSDFNQMFWKALEEGKSKTSTLNQIRKALDFASLSTKYASRIWKQTDNGNRLIHTATAECVLEEVKLACVDLGLRKQFYQYDEHSGTWNKITTLTVKKLVVGIIGDTATDSMAGAIVGLVATLCEVRADMFNSCSHLINLSNQAFDLDNYSAIDHDAKHYFTYNLSYDYNASAQCLFTDAILDQYALGDETWIKCFWEMAGFCLQTPYFINKMFWLVGDGANGKSTVQRLLHELVGHALTKTGFQVRDLGKDFYLYSVIGKRMALCGDAAVRMDNIDLLKQFTGGDALSTNVKFGDHVQFENSAKLILCMNRAPLISSHEALKPITRRIVWLPFEYRIQKPDPTVEKKMLAELPGHFNKAIEGLRRLRNQGAFTRIERGEKALALWAGTANLLEVFIMESIVVEEKQKVRLGELWKAYKKWMDEWGGRMWESDPFNIRSAHQLSREVIARYGCKKEYEQCRYLSESGQWVRGKQAFLYGIGLRDDVEREAPF